MTTQDDSTPEEVAEPVAPAPAAPAPVAPPSPQPIAAAPPAAYAPAATPSYVDPNPTPNTWMNIVSFVTALLGIPVVSVIFGHMGVSAANKGKAELKGLGIAGLIIGYLTIVGYLILIAVVIGAFAASSNY